jgi:F-type H+-transporting ATPase subunit b
MLIDWFTVGAQAVNFLILVWLLKRFLYRPVLAAIEAREKKIADELAGAASREAQAQAQQKEFEQRTATFDREREALMRKAVDEASSEHQRLMEAARNDSQSLRAKLTESLANERQELSRQVSVRTQTEVFALARQTLSDLAGVSLEDRMIEVFLDRLRAIPAEQVRALGQASRGSPQFSPDQLALVRSAFELSPARRAAVEAAVRSQFAPAGGQFVPAVAVHFEVSPECVSGIELRLDGVKVAWSVTDYLASVSRKVTDVLESAEVQHAL